MKKVLIMIIFAVFITGVYGSASFAGGNDPAAMKAEIERLKKCLAEKDGEHKKDLARMKKDIEALNLLLTVKEEEEKPKGDPILERVNHIESLLNDFGTKIGKVNKLTVLEKKLNKRNLELSLAEKELKAITLDRDAKEIIRTLEEGILTINMDVPPVFTCDMGEKREYYTEFEVLPSGMASTSSENRRQELLKESRKAGLTPNQHYKKLDELVGKGGYVDGGRSFKAGPFSFEKWVIFNRNLFLPMIKLVPGAWEPLFDGTKWTIMTARSNSVIATISTWGNWNINGVKAYRDNLKKSLTDNGSTSFLLGARDQAKWHTERSLESRNCLKTTINLLSEYNNIEKYMGKSEEKYFEAQSSECKVYTVKKGDSWWKVAEKQLGCGNKWKKLADFNNADPDVPLEIGQKIRIPN